MRRPSFRLHWLLILSLIAGPLPANPIRADEMAEPTGHTTPATVNVHLHARHDSSLIPASRESNPCPGVISCACQDSCEHLACATPAALWLPRQLHMTAAKPEHFIFSERYCDPPPERLFRPPISRI